MSAMGVRINFGGEDIRVGELYLSAGTGFHVFKYDPHFISSGLEISPFHLPLGKETYTAPLDANDYGLHGVFADSLPDAWGRMVQDAEFLKIGVIEPAALERLAFVGQGGIGALRYHPAKSFPKSDEIAELAAIRKATQKILRGSAEEISEQLLKCGGSAGGARAKFLVDIKENNHSEMRYSLGLYSDGYVPVILKVPTEHDRHQRIEYAYSQIARSAELDIPDTCLVTGEKSGLAFFAMKRFDVKPDGTRYHAHTLSGLLNTNFHHTNSDAGVFLHTVGSITRDHRQIVEGYRRVAFNYIGHNNDDHAKNFSFLMDEKGEWTLAPAYDIGYSRGRDGHHQMTLGNKSGNAEAKDFKNLAKDFDIPKWDAIVEKILSGFEKWPAIAKDCGVPAVYIDRIDNKLKENIQRAEKGK